MNRKSSHRSVFIGRVAFIGGLLFCVWSGGGARAADLEVQIRAEVGGWIPFRVHADCPAPMRLDLWSNPTDGSVVLPGERLEVYVQPSSSSFVAVYSVDPVGRVRRLFPDAYGDGWVRGGDVLRLPGRGAGSLCFTGPAGTEEVFAVASLDPLVHPTWVGERWEGGRSHRGCSPWRCDDRGCGSGLTNCAATGRFTRLEALCFDLVSRPERPERQIAARLSFGVRDRGDHRRTSCLGPRADCGCGSCRPVRAVIQVRVGGNDCDRCDRVHSRGSRCDADHADRKRTKHWDKAREQDCDEDRDHDRDRDRGRDRDGDGRRSKERERVEHDDRDTRRDRGSDRDGRDGSREHRSR